MLHTSKSFNVKGGGNHPLAVLKIKLNLSPEKTGNLAPDLVLQKTKFQFRFQFLRRPDLKTH
jgi:hypothetical protein